MLKSSLLYSHRGFSEQISYIFGALYVHLLVLCLKYFTFSSDQGFDIHVLINDNRQVK